MYGFSVIASVPPTTRSEIIDKTHATNEQQQTMQVTTNIFRVSLIHWALECELFGETD